MAVHFSKDTKRVYQGRSYDEKTLVLAESEKRSKKTGDSYVVNEGGVQLDNGQWLWISTVAGKVYQSEKDGKSLVYVKVRLTAPKQARTRSW